MALYKLREVERGNYSTEAYSNEKSLAALMIRKPEEINAYLTYTYGMDDDRFPLTFLTEGQGASGVKDINSVEWTWKVMGRQKFNDYVTYFNTANTTPGIGGSKFEVHFATGIIIEQYGLVAPDGQTTVRVMKDLGISQYGHGYLLQLKNPDPTAFVDPAMLTKGMYWSMSAPTISESYSKGNRSNVMSPGMMKSQLGFHRYTKEIGGNIANTVVAYEFKTKGGAGTTNMWINEEMRQFDISMRIMNEEHLWIARYNRNIAGEIVMKDLDSGNDIPETAGMLEIASEGNFDTYGEVLTLNKFKRTIGDVLDKDTDTGSMDVVIYGGKGGLEDFHEMLETEAKGQGYMTKLGELVVGANGTGMTYGKYFNQYKTIDGHTITLKLLPFLDKGTIAETAKNNGMIHPRTGLPITSHQLICVDQSIYDGNRNVRMVRMKGQAYITGVLKGLTPVPPSWAAGNDVKISTEIDKSSYEVKMSKGLQVDRNNKCFVLKCVL